MFQGPWLLSGVVVYFCVGTHFFLPCVCVFISQKKKKKTKKGNCSTLLKRVCCVQYNLPHLLLKVTMTFEWSCGVPLCQNPFSSPLCVCCVFVSFKKKKKKVLETKLINQPKSYTPSVLFVLFEKSNFLREYHLWSCLPYKNV